MGPFFYFLERRKQRHEELSGLGLQEGSLQSAVGAELASGRRERGGKSGGGGGSRSQGFVVSLRNWGEILDFISGQLLS